MYVNSVRQWLSAATKHTECASQAYELNELSMVKKLQANSIVLSKGWLEDGLRIQKVKKLNIPIVIVFKFSL